MLNLKNGTSIISLVLCAFAITLVTTALVLANGNSAVFRAQMKENNSTKTVESYAYTKVYNLNEIRSIARQAYVNNYLAFYNNEVSLREFEELVIEEIMQQVPQNQLEHYIIMITPDGVEVQYE